MIYSFLIPAYVHQFDRDGKQRDPNKNNHLIRWLAGCDLLTFAKRCKSLRSVQTQPMRRTPDTARAGGVVCAKFLLQNFYDPNRAGGCGVAPFPSGMRFRVRVSAAAVGRGWTNEKKAERCRPLGIAFNGERYRSFYTIWKNQAISGAYFVRSVSVLPAIVVN